MSKLRKLFALAGLLLLTSCVLSTEADRQMIQQADNAAIFAATKSVQEDVKEAVGDVRLVLARLQEIHGTPQTPPAEYKPRSEGGEGVQPVIAASRDSHDVAIYAKKLYDSIPPGTLPPWVGTLIALGVAGLAYWQRARAIKQKLAAFDAADEALAEVPEEKQVVVKDRMRQRTIAADSPTYQATKRDLKKTRKV